MQFIIINIRCDIAIECKQNNSLKKRESFQNIRKSIFIDTKTSCFTDNNFLCCWLATVKCCAYSVVLFMIILNGYFVQVQYKLIEALCNKNWEPFSVKVDFNHCWYLILFCIFYFIIKSLWLPCLLHHVSFLTTHTRILIYWPYPWLSLQINVLRKSITNPNKTKV